MQGLSRSIPGTGKELQSHLTVAGKSSGCPISISQPFWGHREAPLHRPKAEVRWGALAEAWDHLPWTACSQNPAQQLVRTFISPQTHTEQEHSHLIQVKKVFQLKSKEKNYLGMLTGVNKVMKVI